MEDKRKHNKGTKGNKGGRPSKAEEIKLIEKLSPMAPAAYKAMQKGVEEGDYRFVQLFFAYYAGKPKETKDIDISSSDKTVSINYILPDDK